MKLQLLPWQKSKEELLNKWNEINRDYGPCGEAMLIIPRKDDVLLVMFLITDDFDRDDDEDEDEDKIQISYSVGFYEGGDDLSADIETYDGGFVSYLASKGTGLDTIVQELADFCDDSFIFLWTKIEFGILYMCKAKLCFIHRFLQGIIRKGALQIHLLYIRYSGSRGEMAVAFFCKNLRQYLDKIKKWNTIYSVRNNCSHKSLTLSVLKMSARADAGTSFIII